MAKVNFIKTVGGLAPATDQDKEVISKWKIGDVVSGEFRKVRNDKFHRRFFALLNLAFDYYEPSSGVISPDEKRLADMIFKNIDEQGGNAGVIIEYGKQFMTALAKKRMSQISDVTKSFEAFRKEVIIESGFYDVVATPNGLKRMAKSISFASMDEVEFAEFYKSAFGVLWRLVLSRNFESEIQVEEAILKMLEFN